MATPKSAPKPTEAQKAPERTDKPKIDPKKVQAAAKAHPKKTKEVGKKAKARIEKVCKDDGSALPKTTAELFAQLKKTTAKPVSTKKPTPPKRPEPKKQEPISAKKPVTTPKTQPKSVEPKPTPATPAPTKKPKPKIPPKLANIKPRRKPKPPAKPIRPPEKPKADGEPVEGDQDLSTPKPTEPEPVEAPKPPKKTAPDPDAQMAETKSTKTEITKEAKKATKNEEYVKRSTGIDPIPESVIFNKRGNYEYSFKTKTSEGKIVEITIHGHKGGVSIKDSKGKLGFCNLKQLRKIGKKGCISGEEIAKLGNLSPEEIRSRAKQMAGDESDPKFGEAIERGLPGNPIARELSKEIAGITKKIETIKQKYGLKINVDGYEWNYFYLKHSGDKLKIEEALKNIQALQKPLKKYPPNYFRKNKIHTINITPDTKVENQRTGKHYHELKDKKTAAIVYAKNPGVVIIHKGHTESFDHEVNHIVDYNSPGGFKDENNAWARRVLGPDYEKFYGKNAISTKGFPSSYATKNIDEHQAEIIETILKTPKSYKKALEKANKEANDPKNPNKALKTAIGLEQSRLYIASEGRFDKQFWTDWKNEKKIDANYWDKRESNGDFKPSKERQELLIQAMVALQESPLVTGN